MLRKLLLGCQNLPLSLSYEGYHFINKSIIAENPKRARSALHETCRKTFIFAKSGCFWKRYFYWIVTRFCARNLDIWQICLLSLLSEISIHNKLIKCSVAPEDDQVHLKHVLFETMKNNRGCLNDPRKLRFCRHYFVQCVSYPSRNHSFP